MAEIDKRRTKEQELAIRKENQKAQELEKESRRLDVEWLAKQPQFLRYIRRVLSSGGMMQSVMTGNSQTFYKSGRQDFTREIWAEIALYDRATAMELMTPTKDKD